MSSYITDSIQTFEAAEAYITGIPKFTSKNSMEHTKCFLQQIRQSEKYFGSGNTEEIREIHSWHKRERFRLCLFTFCPAGSRIFDRNVHFAAFNIDAGTVCD